MQTTIKDQSHFFKGSPTSKQCHVDNRLVWDSYRGHVHPDLKLASSDHRHHHRPYGSGTSRQYSSLPGGGYPRRRPHLPQMQEEDCLGCRWLVPTLHIRFVGFLAFVSCSRQCLNKRLYSLHGETLMASTSGRSALDGNVGAQFALPAVRCTVIVRPYFCNLFAYVQFRSRAHWAGLCAFSSTQSSGGSMPVDRISQQGPRFLNAILDECRNRGQTWNGGAGRPWPDQATQKSVTVFRGKPSSECHSVKSGIFMSSEISWLAPAPV